MTRARSRFHLVSVLFLGLSCCLCAAQGGESHEPLAKRILEATGIKGGFIVHVGCGDGKLTAALAAGDGTLVHGLDRDNDNVRRAREHVLSVGVYADVTVDRMEGERLPYVDNLVNLVVAEDLGDVPMDEVMRVLAPRGVAYVRRDGKWTTVTKQWPKGIDQWTHFLHGADGNAVSKDEVVGFPYHIQWVGSPQHSRDHEIATSMDVMVSAGGRIFYVIDEGPTALPHYLPSRWYLAARDAFNGVVLWKRPLSSWRPFLVAGRKSLAADMWRRLVATEDEIYLTETIFGPVIALDAQTGQRKRTYEGTQRTEEIIHEDGILYLVASTLEPQAIDRHQLANTRIEPDTKRIMAVDAGTARILWTKEDEDCKAVHPVTLAAKNGRLLFQNAREVICLESKTGNDIWRYPRASDYARPGYATPTLVVCDDVVLSADRVSGRGSAAKGARGSELIALSAETGNELWRCGCGENVGAGVDVFVANGLVWVGENERRGDSDYNTGRDLHTGRIKKQFSHEEDWPTWHHHRCYRDKATEKYILAGRTGIEFVDMDTGELTTHHWVRGICEYGIMPCNGLIYSPPDQCACYIESKLQGFHALAAKRDGSPPPGQIAPGQRLERGSAYGRVRYRRGGDEGDSWPTLRHDNSRSGYTRSDVPVKLTPRWTAPIGGRLTSLVSAAGKVYVAQPEQHLVHCLDSETGKTAWRYQAGGRVDSPPTISRGYAVFGCRDGWVYALRAADGELAWRFRAAPRDLRLVEKGSVASVWPVHGSVLIESDRVYFAAGRSVYLDGGMYLYGLDLATGKALIEKHYYARDPETGRSIRLFTPYDGEVLPDRELPGLLPDVFSSDGKNLYMRAVPLSPDLVIRDREYVPHLFSSMGFLEDTWWERSYWIYGSHFYGGARGHAYARTLFPGGRILTFDAESVYGYTDLALSESSAGMFRVAKQPEFIDLAAKIASSGKRRQAQSKKQQATFEREYIERTYVWENGVPQNPKRMNLTGSRDSVGDVIRRMVKYEYTWHKDAPLYAQAMVLTDKTFFLAGPGRFDEKRTTEYLRTSRTDEFQLAPLLQDALDKFEGRKGGVLLAADKTTAETLGQLRLPSSPVFDGMIAAGGRLYLSLMDGSVMCLSKQ